MERILWSSLNRVLMAHTGAFSTTCAVNIENCEDWWLSSCCSSMAEHWLHKPGVLVSIPSGCQPFSISSIFTSKHLNIGWRWEQQDKIWEWPGNGANLSGTANILQCSSDLNKSMPSLCKSSGYSRFCSHRKPRLQFGHGLGSRTAITLQQLSSAPINQTQNVWIAAWNGLVLLEKF